MFTSRELRNMAGVSLIELILFIVIVSIAVAGVLSVLNLNVRNSSDPQLRKQALAIAEALLEEVELMPFTFCDPDDPNAGLPGTAGPADCSGGAGGANDEARLPLGSQAVAAGEARGNSNTPFDNVADYNGFTLAGGGADIGGLVSVPAGYTAKVAVVQEAFGPTASQVPTSGGLRITVTVSYNGGADSVAVEGYRAQYAPRATP